MLHKYTPDLVSLINSLLLEMRIDMQCFFGSSLTVDFKDKCILLELIEVITQLTTIRLEYKLQLQLLDSVISTQNLLFELQQRLIQFEYVDLVAIDTNKFSLQIYVSDIAQELLDG